MEENNSMDTPQPQTANTTGMDAFGAPVESNEGSTQENLSVEDAFFTRAEAESQPAPEQGQPAEIQGNENVTAPTEAKNDNTRYEYWQSQAAKKDNELNELKKLVREAAAQEQANLRGQNAPQQAQQAPAQREFPPPPPKPEKPRGFSREEAWSDSNSESARYLDEMEVWNDDINAYRDLRSQYEVAVVREQLEAQEEARRAEAAKKQQYMQSRKQIEGMNQHLQGHYGFSPDEAKDFLQSMSNPDSISVDNLVQLYRMQKGSPQGNPQNTGPSEAFQQSRNAQQIPSPMGVMPGQATESNRSDADTIMDDLINSHNSKNPWG